MSSTQLYAEISHLWLRMLSLVSSTLISDLYTLSPYIV